MLCSFDVHKTSFQDIYQACRGWTIAIFEHITYTDFSLELTEMEILADYSPIVVGGVGECSPSILNFPFLYGKFSRAFAGCSGGLSTHVPYVSVGFACARRPLQP